MEIAYIDVPDEYTGVVIDKLSQRKGELQTMGAAQWWIYTVLSSVPIPWSDRLPWWFPDRHKGKWYHEHCIRRIRSI